MNALLERLMSEERPILKGGVIAQSQTQFETIWKVREGITEAISRVGKAYKFDVSVPLSSFEGIVRSTRRHLSQLGLMRSDAVKDVLGYGHIGDGIISQFNLLRSKS